MLRRPVRLIISSNVQISAHLNRILALSSLARNRNNLVGIHSLCKHHTKVAETTNTDDTNTLAGTTAIVLQRAVQRHTTAQHRGSSSRGNAIGNLNSKVRGHTVVQRIATVGLVTILVSAVVGTGELLGAVLLRTHSTLLAVTLTALARVALGTDSDSIANLDTVGHLRSHANCSANDLVANAARVESGSLSSEVRKRYPKKSK